MMLLGFMQDNKTRESPAIFLIFIPTFCGNYIIQSNSLFIAIRIDFLEKILVI